MMKSLSIKKIVIAILSALFAFCMFAGLAANKVSANTDLERVTLSTTMDHGAQMRLTNPTGMRFIINVDEADFDLFGEDVKVVTMITQKNLLDAKGISVEDFDKDTDVKKAEVVFGASHFQAAKDAHGAIKLTATILEISDKNIAKDYVAKTYITDGEKIGYVEQATVASIFDVATEALKDETAEYDEYELGILAGYTKSCTVTLEGTDQSVKVPYGVKISDLVYGMPECYVVAFKDLDGNPVALDAVVTTDLVMSMSFNHSYKDGKCEYCKISCAHDWDGADCTICDMTREPSVAETTYGADYVAIVDGKVAIDASAINETVDLASVTAVAINGANAEFVIDGNNIVVTTSVYGEGVKFAITVANAEEYKTVTFETIVATNVLNTSDAFVAYLKADHSNTLAVLTANVSAPSGEFYQIPKASNFSIIGVGETKPVVSGWRETVGMFRNGGSGITLKNIELNFNAAHSTILGHAFSGEINLINIKVNARVEKWETTRAWLVYDCKNMTMNVIDSEFVINVDSEKANTVYYLGTSYGSDSNHPVIDSTNTYNFINTVINCTGIIGSHGSNFTFTNCDIKETVFVTYADQYVTTDKTTITIDASKINGASVTGVTGAIVNGTACTASQSGNTISISSDIYGEKQVKLVTANKIYAFDTIIATHVLSDETTFKGYFGKAQHNTYAVITESFAVAEQPEIRPESNGVYFDSFTVNGLGNTVTGIYDYSGMFPTCLGGGTFKNLTFGLKGYECALSDEIGNFTLDNVTLNVTVPGGATARLLGKKIISGRTFTIKDSTINFYVDANNKEKQYVLAEVLDGNINIINSTINSNGTLVGLGETYNGSAWGSGKVTLDATSKITDAFDKVSYADEYVVTNGSAITVDLTKIENVVISNVTSAIVGGTTCTATTSGTTVTIESTANGETTIALVEGTKQYVFDIIIATHVITDDATFRTYFKNKGTISSHGSYAVIDVEDGVLDLAVDQELIAAFFRDYTLNGLGNTVNNLYDTEGFVRGGTANATIKNVTFNMKTGRSTFGTDWLGTNNFINVTMNVFIPGHATVGALLFNNIRGNSTCNFTNCNINFNIDSSKQSTSFALYTVNTSHGPSVAMNFTNSKITSNGTIGAISSEVTLDATSKIIDKNGEKTVA